MMQPDSILSGALNDLKQTQWTPEHGTWLTFGATIDGERIQPSYDHDQEPPGGTSGFKPED